jgi:hypothetical protein
MTPQQRIDFAIEFVMAQKDIESCMDQTLLTHQLKAVGITLKKENGKCFAVHGGEAVEVRTPDELICYLV